MEHKVAFLDLAHTVAKADGFVNPKEKGYIQAFMHEMNIQQAEYHFDDNRDIEEMISQVQEEQVKHIFFVEIMLLVYADGDYNDDEKEIARKLQRLLGLSDSTYLKFKDWVIRMDQLKIEGIKHILS
ncbi:TerB family tellurite resistance protein [Paenibacillus sp. NEAU-GSW1]|uniref:tellurite resistance TerB family protein n=1 Tax=Paenibacillus sp. NEAU-GSW1 TaxID=2682486 RepID=UPI0020A62C58|nr:TerB family tellurite resistance protein [Paenibacillus sp. NEAU-GSW1]